MQESIARKLGGRSRMADILSLFDMEDLLPIVARLTDEYTSKESSSVTFERARKLMAAVMYAMAHFETRTTSLMGQNDLSAEEVYKLGYEAVLLKVDTVKEKYKKLMTFFDGYNNRNYKDTVEKAIPGFFKYYDPKFAPMDNIITMDYPVFKLNMKLEGIDLISQYIDAIWNELQAFSREYVISKLKEFHPKYEREFINLKEIFLMQLRGEAGGIETT